MSREAVIKVGIKYLEENPEVMYQLERRLFATKDIATTAGTAVSLYGRKMVESARGTTILGGRLETVSSRLSSFATRLQRLSFRLSWMAYRLVMIGRIIMRWMTEPIRRTLRTLTDWERGIDTVATTMGLLAATGLDPTGERTEFLTDTIWRLVDVGMPFQAAFMYLLSAIIRLMVEGGEPLIKLFLALGDFIVNHVLPAVQEHLIPVLGDVVDAFIEWLPELIPLIETFLPAFAEGLKEGVEFLKDMVGWVEPFVPMLGNLVGRLFALTPLLIGLGIISYIIAPGLSILAGLLDLFGKGLGKLVGGDMLPFVTNTLLPDMKTGLEGVQTPLGGVYDQSKAMNETLLSIVSKSALLLFAVWALGGLLRLIEDPLEGITQTLEKIPGYIDGITGNFMVFVDLFAPVIDPILRFFAMIDQVIIPTVRDWPDDPVKAFNNAMEKMGEILRPVIGDWEKWGDVLGDVAGEHSPSLMQDLANDMEELTDQTNLLRSAFLNFPVFNMPGVPGGRGFGGEVAGGIVGTQYQTITVNMSVTIEGIEGIADMDMVYATINRAIADAMRRRGL